MADDFELDFSVFSVPDDEPTEVSKPYYETPCYLCGGLNYLLVDFYITCSDCGVCAEDFRITKEVASNDYYKSYGNGYVYKGYQRADNFDKLMKHARGYQKKMIPNALLEEIEDLIDIPTIQSIKNALKKLGKVKYYKHAQLILSLIDRVSTPIPDWIVEKARGIYLQCTEGYDNLKTNKKKMMPFGFMMHRILDLIERKYMVNMEHYRHLFQDAKQKRTMDRNMITWNKIIERKGKFPLIY